VAENTTGPGDSEAGVVLSVRSTPLRRPAPSSVATEPVGAGLTRKAFLNAVSSLLDFGSTLVVGFFITPVLIRSLDNSLFGVWKILQQLVDYMSAADGRPTQALKWVIANQQHDDERAKRISVSSAFITYAIYLPFMAAVGAGLVWLSPTLAKVPPEAETTVRITCALLVLTFVLAGFAQLPAAVLRGENQGYRRMGLAAGLTLVGAVLTVAAAALGFGLIGVAAAQVVVAAGTGLFFSVVVKRYLPWYGFSRPSFAEVRRFLGFSNWFFVSIIVNRLIYSTDVVILGFLTASTVVTTYAVTQFASITAVGLIGAMVGAIVPGLGGVISLGQRDRLADLRAEMGTYSWLLATVIGTTTLLLNRSFIHLWVGLDGHYAGPLANLLIVLVGVQLVFIRNQAYIIDLTLKVVRKSVLGVAAAAISTVLAWLLIPSQGVVGLCLALLSGRMVLTLCYPIVVRDYLGGAAHMSLVTALRQAIVTAVLFASGLLLGERVLIDHWFEWVVAAGVTTALAAGVCFVTGLSRQERAQASHRFGAVVHRGQA
jgi:O-antigen/teichoic acid export membrane protein